MPQTSARTRSGTLRQTTLQLTSDVAHKRKRPQPATPSLSQDVIELSSDDEAAAPPKKPLSRRKAPVAHEVLEISDSDDGNTKSRTKASSSRLDENASPGQRNRAIQKENDDLKKKLYDMRKKLDFERSRTKSLVQDLQEHKKELSKVSNAGFEELDDELSCEICAMKMWSPYLLPECGHVFCQGCLTNWFATTHAQYLSNPANIALPNHYQQALRNPTTDPHSFIAASMFLAQHPQPKYTCPACRKPVTRKPVEDYTLKKVITYVASVQGEKCPAPALAARGTGPWDGFFPL